MSIDFNINGWIDHLANGSVDNIMEIIIILYSSRLKQNKHQLSHIFHCTNKLINKISTNNGTARGSQQLHRNNGCSLNTISTPDTPSPSFTRSKVSAFINSTFFYVKLHFPGQPLMSWNTISSTQQ